MRTNSDFNKLKDEALNGNKINTNKLIADTIIEEDKIHLSTPDGDKVIDNDFVLAMTGYQPDFSFLTKLGIELGDDENKTPVHDPESMESNVEGIYLAGVICGGLKTNKWFIENSRDHAKIIFSHLK